MLRKSVVLYLLTFICIASTASSGELVPEVDVSTGIDIYSKYIWRGQNLEDDWSIQPSLDISYKGFTASVWGSYGAESEDWNELDFTFDYTIGLGALYNSLEKLSFSLGYSFYTFPNLEEDDSSHEIYFGLGLDVLLSPSLYIYYDWDTGDGVYYEGALTHAFEFEYFSISPSASIGYNDGQWGYDSSWSAALLSLNLSIPIGDYFTVGGSLAESVALDEQYDDEFYGGFNLSVSF